MDFVCIVLGSLFCGFGILFALGKIHVHMGFWKAMSPEERSKIKIVPLCRNIGEVILLNGVIFLLKGLWQGFSKHWFTLAIIAWFVVAVFDLWHISKSGRYQKEEILMSGGKDE